MARTEVPWQMSRRGFLGTAGSLALLSAFGPAQARPAPSMLSIVCGFAAGGTSDVFSRQVAAGLQGNYAESVIVENRPGAQAQIAIGYVKSQPADGRTILQVPMSMFSIVPQAFKSVPYRQDEFVPITAGCRAEYGYAVGPMVPESVKTIEQYAAWVRQSPANVTFATTGVLPQLIGLLLGKVIDVPLEPVMYKGGALASQDAMAGHVPGTVTTVGDLMPYVGPGKLRFLATTGKQRHPMTPDVPTFAEQGLPDMTLQTYFSFFVPAQTPLDLVDRHSEAFRAVLRQPSVSDAVSRLALQVVPADRQETAQILAEEYAQWEAYIKRIGHEPI